jgi:hypothetical protein
MVGNGHASHKLGVLFAVNCTSRSESSQLLNTVTVIMAMLVRLKRGRHRTVRKASNRTTPILQDILYIRHG